jgi:mitochondrial chaperone BCS1
MVQLLKGLLSGENQFASGGLLLMIIGGISVYLRQVPLRLWYWIQGQAMLTLTVTDDDSAFEWVKEWFLEQEFVRRVRRLDLDTAIRGDDLALIPAPGSHCFWHARRPFVVYFSRNENTNGLTQRRTQSLTFVTMGRKPAVLRKFVEEIWRCHVKNIQVEPSLFIFDDHWRRVRGYEPRALDSVILNRNEKQQLIEDVKRFKASRERYRQLGVPYHRGYLLYGPPGTGKTSLVSAIAARFDMRLYLINLADFTDRSLMKAMNDIPGGSVILFEDIDCTKGGKARTEVSQSSEGNSGRDKEDLGKSGVTLSGLLNVLDGFCAPENVLFMMTSNRVESLDPALLRPGRIDYRLYLGKATEEQKIELYRRFFPGTSDSQAKDFVETHYSADTMAEFQGLLLSSEKEEDNSVSLRQFANCRTVTC